MLLVANHVSWLDVFVINAAAPSDFVCKAEVHDWPLAGWLAAATGTVFLERASARAARRCAEEVARRLAGGSVAVAVFPEGTTGEGRGLLPFRAALLEGALAAGAAVAPLALRYVDRHGRPAAAALFVGDTSLATSLWRIACADGLCAQLDCLPPIAVAGLDRGRLTEAARRAVGRRLAGAAPQSAGAPAPPTAGAAAAAAWLSRSEA